MASDADAPPPRRRQQRAVTSRPSRRTISLLPAAALLLVLVVFLGGSGRRVRAEWDPDAFDDAAFGDFGDDDAGGDGGTAEAELERAASRPMRQDELSSRSLLWGTYRPQIYFGLRPKLAKTMLTGLVWMDLEGYDAMSHARHDCRDEDGMQGYKWRYHDGRSFGDQDIVDVKLNYRLRTQWIRLDDAAGASASTLASAKGSSWAARISGEVIDPSQPATITPLFYVGLESEKGSLEAAFDEEAFPDGVAAPEVPGESMPLVSGSQAEMGAFIMRFADTPGYANEVPEGLGDGEGKWLYKGVAMPPEVTWRGSDILLTTLNERAQRIVKDHQADKPDRPPPPVASLLRLDNEVRSGSNFFAVQRHFRGNFSFDVFFDGAAHDAPAAAARSGSAGGALESRGLTEALEASRRAFDERFEATFALRARGRSDDEVTYARELTSSLLGGVGFYHGASVVDRSFRHGYDAAPGSGALPVDEEHTPDPRLTEERELLTATPSRSKFPRGFYWDEGFHLAHIGAWDNDLALEIFKSWINLVDEDGWVAREQILGEEARSRVPKEFQTQYPDYANPPTPILALSMYIDRLVARQSDAVADQLAPSQLALNPALSTATDARQRAPNDVSSRHLDNADLARSYLRSVYAKLRRHYLWFRRTQRGEIKEWERDARARHEAFRWRGRTKQHVLTSGLDDYPRAAVPHSGELHVDLMSWMGCFARTMHRLAEAVGEREDAREFARHYEGILTNLEDLHWSEEKKMFCDASVNENDESYLECHRGYLSLFPLLLGLLGADDPKLGHVLDLLEDPEEIWSEYGLLSLSRRHPLFGQGEDYWRGPIWMPINYLAVQQLYSYASQPGPYRARALRAAEKLKTNLIDNTLKEYRRTGFTWEQFSPHDGRGQRSHPFTGWSSLPALLMTMQTAG